MPEFQQDYLTEELVLYAPGRRKKPYAYSKNKLTQEIEHQCPFCPGFQHLKPDDIYRSEDGEVRIFPNLYPAVTPEWPDAYGYHDVLVDTASHQRKMHQFSTAQLIQVFQAIQFRTLEIQKDNKIRYIQVFKNEGPQAGASIAHSHWQIMATAAIPVKQSTIARNMAKYYNKHGACYLCNLVRRLDKHKVWIENASFTAYAPEASLYAFTIHIMPKGHLKDIVNADVTQLADLSSLLLRVLNGYQNMRPGLSYNICLQGSLLGAPESESHFYLVVIPRVGSLAGYEMSTGCFINPVYPQEAVKTLRKHERNPENEN